MRRRRRHGHRLRVGDFHAGDNVENLVLTEVGISTDGTGNASGNAITGNAYITPWTGRGRRYARWRRGQRFPHRRSGHRPVRSVDRAEGLHHRFRDGRGRRPDRPGRDSLDGDELRGGDPFESGIFASPTRSATCWGSGSSTTRTVAGCLSHGGQCSGQHFDYRSDGLQFRWRLRPGAVTQPGAHHERHDQSHGDRGNIC